MAIAAAEMEIERQLARRVLLFQCRLLDESVQSYDSGGNVGEVFNDMTFHWELYAKERQITFYLQPEALVLKLMRTFTYQSMFESEKRRAEWDRAAVEAWDAMKHNDYGTKINNLLADGARIFAKEIDLFRNAFETDMPFVTLRSIGKVVNGIHAIVMNSKDDVGPCVLFVASQARPPKFASITKYLRYFFVDLTDGTFATDEFTRMYCDVMLILHAYSPLIQAVQANEAEYQRGPIA
jgi:hypothetical protein